MAASYEHGNERLGSINSREFLDHLSDCQLLNKECSLFISNVFKCCTKLEKVVDKNNLRTL
jgi:hypothetical protein